MLHHFGWLRVLIPLGMRDAGEKGATDSCRNDHENTSFVSTEMKRYKKGQTDRNQEAAE